MKPPSMIKNAVKKPPSLIKIAVIFLTAWIIFLYHQFLHTRTYNSNDATGTVRLALPRQIPMCRGNVTIPTTFKLDDKERRCRNEFNRVTEEMPDHLPGLTEEDYERSIAHVGNRYRIATFVQKLIQSSSTASINRNKPVTVVVCGGSITMGHGVEPSWSRYAATLETWMNDAYPVAVDDYRTDSNTTSFDAKEQTTLKYNFEDKYPNRHRTYFRGGHGANICSMAKRLNYLKLPRKPDMFIFEFAVNNYQAEDHLAFVDHKTDVYFDGFEKFVECTEVVIGRLLTEYPEAAILFLDMHSAVPNRKTAQSLHVGVAQHYQIPVLSYADVMMPDYFRLIEVLKPYNYSIPSNMVQQVEVDFPFPHGCAPCRLNELSQQFHHNGCWSLCWLMKGGKIFRGKFTDCDQGHDVLPCYVPIFDHDEVHPSRTGHRIARDLIIHLLARVSYDLCQGRTFTPHQLPIHGGWIVASSSADTSYMTELLALSDYVTVQDVKYNFAKTEPMVAQNHTQGFAIVDDSQGRTGWVATEKAGGERITFAIRVPEAKCYAVSLTILKSYKTVGKFTAEVFDVTKNKTTKLIDVDCLWGARISVPVDIELTKDGSTDCTGNCTFTVTTHPEIEGRDGNLIKITSLLARRCV